MKRIYLYIPAAVIIVGLLIGWHTLQAPSESLVDQSTDEFIQPPADPPSFDGPDGDGSNDTDPTSPNTVQPAPPVNPPPVSTACYVGGCSSQICSDDPEVMTTCEWREEYACFQTATCERQPDGECGWTQTPELLACIFESR